MLATPTRAGIRAHFPALAGGGALCPPVFFDGPAGSQVPQPVVDAVADYLTFHNANTGGAFRSSVSTDELILGARERLAAFLGAGTPREIVFGANMTTLTFSLSRALRRGWSAGDEIVVTELDHQANVAPWRLAAEEAGARVHSIPFDPETLTLDYEALESVLGHRTRLVAIGYASNVTGTVNEVRRVAALAREAGALSFVDAVHFAPHGSIDVRDLGCDFLVCSAYKFFGPHVGVLWGREELLERVRPCKVPPAPDAGPERWETGTLAHEGIVGAAAAVEWIASLAPASQRSSWRERVVGGMATIEALETELLDRLLDGLAEVPGIRLYSPPRGRPRTPTIAFTLRSASPRQAAERLAEDGICVWDGDFYASSVIDRLGLRESGGVVRVGLAPYNTEEEVDRLLSSLHRVAGSGT